MLPAHVFEFIKKGLSYRNATANILVECWKHFSLPDTCPPIAHRRTYSCLPEGRFWALLGAPFPWRGEGKGRKPTSHSSFFKWLLWKCCFSIFKCLWILGLKIKKKNPVAARSAAACLLGLRVRIPQCSWISVCCECCVLSGTCTSPCVGLIAARKESYRVPLPLHRVRRRGQNNKEGFFKGVL